MEKITIKTAEDLEKLKASGKILAATLSYVAGLVKPGVSVDFLNDAAEKKIAELGGVPAFLGYTPQGVARPYPAGLCVSVNEEVVHGIPNEDPRTLKEGDIVSLDCGVKYEGMFTDSALTVPVGEIDQATKELLSVTENALYTGIDACRAGNTVGDVGYAIEKSIPAKYGIVRELAGHGVGYAVHEPPLIPNFGSRGKGDEFVPGMVVAIEPMVNLGSADVLFLDDDYTVVTEDGKKSAHFEHTIIITEDEPVIVTAR